MALPARAVERIRLYTNQEFENMPEFYERYELVDGRLVKKLRRDETMAKVRRYQAAGVRLVWVIDPKAKRVEIYRPGQLAPIEILSENATLEDKEMLPSFKINVSKLFDY